MGGDNGGDAKPPAPTPTAPAAMTAEDERSSTRSMVLLVVGSLLLALFLMFQMTRGEPALAGAAAAGGAPNRADGVAAETQVEAAEAQTLALDAMESGVGDAGLTAKAAGGGAGAGFDQPSAGRSDADVLPDGFGVDAAAAAASSAAATPAAIGGGVVELGGTGAAAFKSDLNGGLPDPADVTPVGSARTGANDRAAAAAAAATGGDAFAFGAAAGAGGAAGAAAGPGATTEAAFEKEAAIAVDPATGFEDTVELDPETAWRERFHDGYWRRVVGALASDEAAWKAAADRAFALRKEIVAAYVSQRNSDSVRDAVVAVLACFLLAGVGVAGFKLCWEDGGVELSSVVSFSGGGGGGWGSGGGGGGAVLPSRMQDVLAAAKAGRSIAPVRSAAAKEAFSVAAKDLSKCSTDELKAQLDRLRSRKE